MQIKALSTLEEIQKTVALHKEAMSPLYLKYTIHSSPKIDHFLFDQSFKPSNIFLGAFLEKELAGYCHLILNKESAHLNNIAVSPSIQSQGVGRFLLSKIEEIAKEKSLKRISLDVFKSNKKALNWYLNQNFKEKSSIEYRVIAPAKNNLKKTNLSHLTNDFYQKYGFCEIQLKNIKEEHIVGILSDQLFRIKGLCEESLINLLQKTAPEREILLLQTPDIVCSKNYKLQATALRMNKYL